MASESQLQLRAVLDSLTEGVVLIGLDGQVLHMNPAAMRLSSLTRIDDARRSQKEFADDFELHALDGRMLSPDEWPLARVLRGESFVDYELRVTRKDDGDSRLISYNGTPVVDEDGTTTLGVLTLRDISERKRNELALREGERRLALALAAGGSAVWEMDVATDLIRGSDNLYTMYGYSPIELRTLTEWATLVHDEDLPAIRKKMDDAIRGEIDGYGFESRLRCKDGTWRWNQSQALVTERDAEGRATRMVGTHTDITARKAVEQEVQRLNAELEQRVQERTRELEHANEVLLHRNLELQSFAHAMAHDLKTPLRSIVSFTQLLQEAVRAHGDAEVDLWASQVVDNTRRLQTLIEDLLSYTRLDAQGLPLNEVDMEALLAEVVGFLQSLICNTGASVCSEGLPKIAADRTQMAQLLQNLIENGIKYNSSRPPTVSVSCERQGGEWIFSVADNGIGIAPRHHRQIFDMFKRLHTHARIPGSGIGLALCRRIVERHGGHIWVESREGGGSTFRFTLPAERPDGERP